MSRNLLALQNKFLGEGETVYDKLCTLHEEQGYISDGDIQKLAEQFHLPPQHVRATAKFYEELQHSTPAKHTIKICNGEACHAAGYKACQSKLLDAVGLDDLGTADDGSVRIEHVACLGYCGSGPSAMIDGDPVSLAGDDALDQVIAHAQDKAAHTLTEPVNAIYLPPEGSPRVLLRHFDKSVVALDDARKAGVYTSLEKAVGAMTPTAVLDALIASQLRGRGGAGFPAGIKLQTVARSESKDGRKFVVINADEGDAGSYIDKELMERDPHTQLEGALLAAYACGAQHIYFYIRYEYPAAQRVMQQTLDAARAAGILGDNIFNSGFSCNASIVRGQGAYICGEETSLLRSIEGVPAIVSFKPPYPAEKGLWNCPTAVFNVETIHNSPWIVEHGGEAYAAFGHDKTRGTKLISLNTRVKNPGIYEIELGITLREVIFDLAGGMAEGQTFKAVQVGGPLGGLLPESKLDTPLAIEQMAQAGGILGHAGIVVYSQEDDLMDIARGLMHFCAVESCGKCFPCRIGSVRGTELFDQMMDPAPGSEGVTDEKIELLDELCDTMKVASLCALGGLLPTPVQNLIHLFPEEIDRYRKTETSAEPSR